MNLIEHQIGDSKIVEVESDAVVINSEQDALDLMANVGYQCGSHKIIVSKKNVNESFFDLKTGLAGAILQKFANYNVKLAIIGDFSQIESKSLRDFIFESNKKKLMLFLPDVESALRELG